jgi:hypothetical protein
MNLFRMCPHDLKGRLDVNDHITVAHSQNAAPGCSRFRRKSLPQEAVNDFSLVLEDVVMNAGIQMKDDSAHSHSAKEWHLLFRSSSDYSDSRIEVYSAGAILLDRCVMFLHEILQRDSFQ